MPDLTRGPSKLQRRCLRTCAAAALVAIVAFAVRWSVRHAAAEEPAPAGQSAAAAEPADGEKELFAGKVVLLPEAFKRRGIRAADEMKDQAVLETGDGKLIPLVADWRGRAFFQDERLRNRRVEIVGTRPKGTPYVQVLMIFTFDEKGRRQYTDYWCDICAIPMYEIKPCDCCQGDTRLRFQPQELPEYIRTGNEVAARKGESLLPLFRDRPADPLTIPEAEDIDRIVVRANRGNIRKPRIISDPKRISDTLEFLQQRNKNWRTPWDTFPAFAYSASFERKENREYKSVLSLGISGGAIGGRNSGQDAGRNRLREISDEDAVTLMNLLEIIRGE